jgi:hypothetical protein
MEKDCKERDEIPEFVKEGFDAFLECTAFCLRCAFDARVRFEHARQSHAVVRRVVDDKCADERCWRRHRRQF